VVLFSLNEQDEQMVLQFNEPVVGSSLNASKLTIAAHANGNAQNYTLTGGTVAEIADSATMTLTFAFNQVDMAAIKDSDAIAGNASSTFLLVAEGAVVDVSSKEIEAASIQGSLVEDSTLAQLVSYTLDLTTRHLTLTFNDIMAPGTLAVGGIAIQDTDGKTSPKTLSYTLTDSAAATTTNSRVITIALSDADFLGLAEEGALATSTSNTFLALSAVTLDDVFDRDVVSIADNNALPASKVTTDSKTPSLSSSTLDMSQMVLKLTFSEAVNSSTFQVDAIKIQSATDGGTTFGIAEDSDVTFAADLQSCEIKIDATLEDKLKRDMQIATYSSNTFLAFTSLVSDFAGNVMANVTATSVTTVKPDTVRPRLESFGVNILDGCMELNFTEVINASTVNVSKFTLQGVENFTEADSSSP
jgi:hypothetical protein